MMPARTALARPPAAVRLDRLPISGFHRDMVKLLAYIFFFELGDLNSFAFAAPGIRAEWQLPLSAIGTITSAAFVGMFVRRDDGRLVLRPRGPETRACRHDRVVFGVLADERVRVERAVALRHQDADGRGVVVDDGRRDDLHRRDVPGPFARRLPGADSDDWPDRHSGDGICGAVPHPDGVLGLAGGVRVGRVRDRVSVVRPQARGIAAVVRAPGPGHEADAVMARIEARVRAETGELPPVPDGWTASTAKPGGVVELVRSGSLRRAIVLIAIWSFQTLGIYGFLTWVPTLLVEHGFSIVRSLERSSAMSIGAVPGAWIGEKISDRWERKTLIAIVALVIATFGMSYGFSSQTVTIVVFGFLVAMSQQVFAALLYAYTPECFPTAVRNTGAGLAYGGGRLANAFGPLLVAFLFANYGYASVFELHRDLLGDGRDSDHGVRPETRGKTLA